MMAFKNSDYASLFQFIVHQLVKKKKKKDKSKRAQVTTFRWSMKANPQHISSNDWKNI